MPRVLLTRPADQVAPLREAFTAAGWDVVCQAAITIAPPISWDELDAVINELREQKTKGEGRAFDWILFSSANGVRFFADRWWPIVSGTLPLSLRLGGVGRETARAVERVLSRAVDRYSTEATAATLAVLLAPEAQRGERFLSIRGSRGGDALRTGLESAGGFVTEVVAYRSLDITTAEVDPQINAIMQSGAIDWVAVTSSAIARSLVALWGESLRHISLLAIGPVTAATLTELGFPPRAMAATADVAGLVSAATALYNLEACGQMDGVVSLSPTSPFIHEGTFR